MWSSNLGPAAVPIQKLSLKLSTWITPSSRCAEDPSKQICALEHPDYVSCSPCSWQYSTYIVNVLQDGQEFLKLLLSLLETKLAESGQAVSCTSSEHNMGHWYAVQCLLQCMAIITSASLAQQPTCIFSMQAVQNLVPDLFRGTSAYETICKASCLPSTMSSGRSCTVLVISTPAASQSTAWLRCCIVFGTAR